MYFLPYARLYYSPPEGGIDFYGDTPAYLDFAYFALTIGMTFQGSDTDFTHKRVRCSALHHALLSYVFGTVIVAITVSSVAALLGNSACWPAASGSWPCWARRESADCSSPTQRPNHSVGLVGNRGVTHRDRAADGANQTELHAIENGDTGRRRAALINERDGRAGAVPRPSILS